ncbi:DUF2238 domain-containing protein [Candidatus Pacearchaeota archaeon]|nr:DUF2238 domain-containing protein [Candidatus Pacearchaeota archaeon]
MNKRLIPIHITTLMLIIFTTLFVLSGNYEFLAYSLIVGILIYAIIKTDEKFKYPTLAKWGFALWLFLHASGGYFYFSGVRLYDTILIQLASEPYFILRYDQLMHIYAYFIVAFFIYAIFKKITKKKFSKSMAFFIVFFATVGTGSLYESVEFSTTIFYPAGGVGTYVNNQLDLIFNAIGAFLGTWFVIKKVQ